MLVHLAISYERMYNIYILGFENHETQKLPKYWLPGPITSQIMTAELFVPWKVGKAKADLNYGLQLSTK